MSKNNELNLNNEISKLHNSNSAGINIQDSSQNSEPNLCQKDKNSSQEKELNLGPYLDCAKSPTLEFPGGEDYAAASPDNFTECEVDSDSDWLLPAESPRREFVTSSGETPAVGKTYQAARRRRRQCVVRVRNYHQGLMTLK